ncbi:hypothetical protein [Halomonas sp. GD1P12]|uniref:hypothetical protein n=1 Tax=Halomonas sp. GD1P12 TaxID=2982691 RepID=UPI0021E3C87C|nr:hypothetical protein [Halomonas sp. GD1P12]UYG00214.1 hypothetical protein OCT39_01280 [Halomonas sp. GD1P12]
MSALDESGIFLEDAGDHLCWVKVIIKARTQPASHTGASRARCPVSALESSPPWLTRPVVWRLIDVGVALMMITVALQLIFGATF